MSNDEELLKKLKKEIDKQEAADIKKAADKANEAVDKQGGGK